MDIARAAAKKVKLTYKNHKKPILTIAEALKYPTKENCSEEEKMIETYEEELVDIKADVGTTNGGKMK